MSGEGRLVFRLFVSEIFFYPQASSFHLPTSNTVKFLFFLAKPLEKNEKRLYPSRQPLLDMSGFILIVGSMQEFMGGSRKYPRRGR